MNKKRLSINLIANLFQFFVGLIISFYFTPFIINSVSKEAYGFFALAGNMIIYITLLGVALNSMAGRFITLEWHKENYQLANEYFNTTLFANGFLSVILVFASALIVVFLEHLIQIPSNLIFDVKILFGLTLFSGIITTSFNVFNVATLCTNRLDLKSIVTIITSFIRIGILYFLFVFLKPNIFYLGISAIIVVIIESYFNLVFLKKLMSKIKISFKYFNKKLIIVLVSSGIWNTVNQLNTIMITGLDILMANLLLSPSSAGSLAISKTIPSMIFSLTAMVGGVFLPEQLKIYANNNFEQLKKHYNLSFNLMGVFSSILLAGFCVFGSDFYRLWLPNEDSNLLFYLSLLTMLQMFVDGNTVTMGNAVLLANKLKVPVLVTTARAVIGIFIVLYFIKYTNLGLYAIAGVSSVLGIIHNLAFSVPYTAKCIESKKSFYYFAKFKFFLVVILHILIFISIKKVFVITSWLGLLKVVFISSFIGFIINYYIYLNKEHRKHILSVIIKIIKR